MVRATTGGVLRSYRYNLMNSFITDNKARETVLTQRVFNSYAEDPAAAAKAFRLRKSRLMASSQLKICDDTYKKFQTAFAALQGIDELIDTENGTGTSTLKSTTLEMLNDPTGDARQQLNTVLDQLSETIVQSMNQTYGDDFMFAGADGRNVPFTVEEVDGHKTLYYRGIPVDAQEPKLMEDSGAAVTDDVNGDYVLASATLVDPAQLPNTKPAGGPPTVVSANGTDYYLIDTATPVAANTPDAVEVTESDGTTKNYYASSDLLEKSSYDSMMGKLIKDGNGDPITVTIGGKTSYIQEGGTITEAEYKKASSDAAKLKYLANEKRFVDIGLGFQEDDTGRLIESSAFNDSLSGLSFLGYGLDDDGDPKNIFSIVQKLKEIAKRTPDGGKWSKADYDEFFGLVGKLEDASSEFKTQFTNHSAGTEKLKNNYNLLEDNVYNLKEQYSNLEDVDMADAITSFLWAEYCYNAALKVGNSVLGQTLMDYMS